MPALDLTTERPINGTALDATQLANGFTEIQTVVNALDATNWASGQLFAPSKLTAEGAASGNFMRWNGSLWAPAALVEADLPSDIPVTKLEPGVNDEVLTTVAGVSTWAPASGGGGGDPVPTGVVFFTADDVAPAGYLLCDGAAVSRATFSTLFSAIGTTYGVGDGSTTFNVPNLKGRVPVGVDAAQTEFDALAEAGGAKTHALSTAELAAHTHTDGTLTTASHGHTDGTLAAASHTHADGTLGVMVGPPSYAAGAAHNAITTASGSSDPTLIQGSTGSAGADVTGSTGSAAPDVTGATGSSGSGTAHNNLQPYLALNGIIKT